MENSISARAALLQSLVNEPGYGSDLVERIKAVTAGVLVFGVGSVYPAIRELETEGLIAKSESKGRASLYKITPAGKKAADKNRKAIAALFGF